MRWLLALLLLVPTASAGVAFEMDLEDAAGDVKTFDKKPANYTSVDILRFSSTVVNGTVRQRVELSSRPIAPDDSILVRNWFHNSSNGSFWVVDMEVRGNEPDVAKRFKPYMRRERFENVTYLDARYGVDGNAWVFEFNASYVEDASCYDPGVFTEHTPPQRTRLPQGVDELYLTDARRCLTAEEPAPEIEHLPSLRVGVPTPAEPPGSRAPTPGAGALGALLVLAAAARARR